MKMHHPHIMKVYGLFVEGRSRDGFQDEKMLIYSEMLGESLYNLQYLPPYRDGPFPMHLAQKWVYQIASALDYLQSLGVCHRFIAPDNVLITNRQDNDIKLSDGIKRLDICL